MKRSRVQIPSKTNITLPAVSIFLNLSSFFVSDEMGAGGGDGGEGGEGGGDDGVKDAGVDEDDMKYYYQYIFFLHIIETKTK